MMVYYLSWTYFVYSSSYYLFILRDIFLSLCTTCTIYSCIYYLIFSSNGCITTSSLIILSSLFDLFIEVTCISRLREKHKGEAQVELVRCLLSIVNQRSSYLRDSFVRCSCRRPCYCLEPQLLVVSSAAA